MTFDIGLHEVCVRTGVRYVITKFSGMDSLPNFLTHGAALRARGSSAITYFASSLTKISIFPLLNLVGPELRSACESIQAV